MRGLHIHSFKYNYLLTSIKTDSGVSSWPRSIRGSTSTAFYPCQVISSNVVPTTREPTLILKTAVIWTYDKEGHSIYILYILYNSTKKRQHYFDTLKAFFVRHSSEYKTSDSDQKVNRNIYPDAVTRDRMRLFDP